MFPKIFADKIQIFSEIENSFLRYLRLNLRKSARNLILIIFLVHNFVSAQDTSYLKYSRTITKEELSAHVYKLASAEFDGRYTGSRGQIRAEEYIKDEFRKYGLEEPVIAGKQTYVQDFVLDNCRWKDQRLMVNGHELKVGKDFLFLSDPVDVKGTYPVVFAGFGIQDSAYSDLANIDLKGKIMLVFSGEPRDAEGLSIISGKEELSKKGYYFSKEAVASTKGAAGVIIIARQKSDYKKYLKDRDYYDHSPKISYPGKDEEMKMHKGAFSAFMDIKTAAKLVSEKPENLEAALKEMESSHKTTAGRYTGSVTIDASNDCIPLQTGNVAGIVEGTDLKDEAVVVVAHYDHLGEKGGQIYYGADDNASGTAAVMSIAEAFARAAREGVRPRRTLVFLAVSAEELGLYGSKFYTQNPLISLDSTYACVDIDMIGRASTGLSDDPDYISGDVYLSPDLLQICRNYDKLIAPDLEDRMQFKGNVRGGSDYYYFALHGIPSLFYFEGFHKDYHEPTDTPDKILYTRMEKIVRAIFATTWELANREGKLKIGN